MATTQDTNNVTSIEGRKGRGAKKDASDSAKVVEIKAKASEEGKEAAKAPAKTSVKDVSPTHRHVVKEGKNPEFYGIRDPKDPVTHTDVNDFIRQYANNHPHNVEVVPLESCNLDSARPIPFTNMEKGGPRANIMWILVNGLGDKNSPNRRLDDLLKATLKHGMSSTRMKDLVAALNGGYSENSKHWGTPYVKLRVVGHEPAAKK